MCVKLNCFLFLILGRILMRITISFTEFEWRKWVVFVFKNQTKFFWSLKIYLIPKFFLWLFSHVFFFPLPLLCRCLSYFSQISITVSSFLGIILISSFIAAWLLIITYFLCLICLFLGFLLFVCGYRVQRASASSTSHFFFG